jgi:hypothetical protein
VHLHRVKQGGDHLGRKAGLLLTTGERVLGDMAMQFVGDCPTVDAVDAKRLRDHRAKFDFGRYDVADDADAAGARYEERRHSYAGASVGLGCRLHIHGDERTGDDEDSEPRR